jgi:hypothetical protein
LFWLFYPWGTTILFSFWWCRLYAVCFDFSKSFFIIETNSIKSYKNLHNMSTLNRIFKILFFFTFKFNDTLLSCLGDKYLSNIRNRKFSQFTQWIRSLCKKGPWIRDHPYITYLRGRVVRNCILFRKLFQNTVRKNVQVIEKIFC